MYYNPPSKLNVTVPNEANLKTITKGDFKIPIIPSQQSLYDRIHNVPSREVSRVTMAILDRIQSEPVDIQIVAACTVFLTIARRFSIAPSILLNACDNMLRYSKRYAKAAFKAVEQYFDNEIN